MTTPVPMPSSTRQGIRQGIAAYFGGTLNQSARAYQGGPLLPYGLGSMRYSYGKEVNMNDFFAGAPAGQGFGAVGIVTITKDQEVRRSIAGAPILDAEGDIVAGGWKMITYDVSLDCYFMAQQAMAEDAEQNCDILMEAMKEKLRQDRTMGGICIDGGETTQGIRTAQQAPTQDRNKRVFITFQIQFQVRVMIVA